MPNEPITSADRALEDFTNKCGTRYQQAGLTSRQNRSRSYLMYAAGTAGALGGISWMVTANLAASVGGAAIAIIAGAAMLIWPTPEDHAAEHLREADKQVQAVEKILETNPSTRARVTSAIRISATRYWPALAGHMISAAHQRVVGWGAVASNADMWDTGGHMYGTGITMDEYIEQILLTNEHMNLLAAVDVTYILDHQDKTVMYAGKTQPPDMIKRAAAVINVTCELIARFAGHPYEQKLFIDMLASSDHLFGGVEMREMANVAFLTLDR